MTLESEEGDPLETTHRVRVEPHAHAARAEGLYRNGRQMFDVWLDLVPPFLRNYYIDTLTSSKDFQGRDASRMFRRLSKQHGNPDLDQTEMQRTCNDRLWTHNEDGSLNYIESSDIVPLFAPGHEADWPNLLLTANHARAGKTEDLSELMKGFRKLGEDAWDREIDLCRLSHGVPPGDTRGKTIIALACHTESDIFLNGAELIDRRIALQEDVNIDHPAKRTRAHMSPVSPRLAKLILKTLVEPDPARPKLVDLARAKEEYANTPFVADDHDAGLVIRADATRIAQRIKLEGFSKGAEGVASALRFLFAEHAALGQRIHIREADGSTRVATDADMKQIISNIGILSISPGEVPLSKAERDVVGMRRVTLVNTNDYTAGHLVLPNKKAYDRWSDRLVPIEGTTEESGHSVKATLGTTGVRDAEGRVIEPPRTGFIMDSRNADKPNYEVARDEIAAFYASLHGIQAVTTVCLSPEGADNVLYLQFAPGACHSDDARMSEHIRHALHNHGFGEVTIESDLSQRRRVRIVLDHEAGHAPIVTNHEKTWEVMAVDHDKIDRCRAALRDIRKMPDNDLFVTADVDHYLAELQDKHPTTEVSEPARAIEAAGKKQGGPAFE
ncbi:MAG: hypothetical protein ACKVOE_04450 [Rickettsiales bacterium]